MLVAAIRESLDQSRSAVLSHLNAIDAVLNPEPEPAGGLGWSIWSRWHLGAFWRVNTACVDQCFTRIRLSLQGEDEKDHELLPKPAGCSSVRAMR